MVLRLVSSIPPGPKKKVLSGAFAKVIKYLALQTHANFSGTQGQEPI